MLIEDEKRDVTYIQSTMPHFGLIDEYGTVGLIFFSFFSFFKEEGHAYKQPY
jgi:hypothetical protein